MFDRKAPKNGFKSYKQQPNRKPRQIVTYQWVNRPLGKFMKITIGLIADERILPARIIDREFRKDALTAKYLLDQLKEICPFAEKEFMRGNSGTTPLNENIVYDRWHKMVHHYDPDDPDARPIYSKEHYLISKKLRPHVPAVAALFRRHRETGKPVTENEALEAIDKANQFL